MKVFGTVDSFIETGGDNLRIGRVAANAGFIKALMRFGNFDAYHVFCPLVSNLKLLGEVLERALPEPQLRQRVMLSTHLLLQEHLARVDYHAFHVSGWGMYVPRLAYLRARSGGTPFPITGVIHSLHTADIFPKCREVLKAPLTAHDAIVCTSQAGEQVLRHFLSDAQTRLEQETQKPHPLNVSFRRIPLGIDEGLLETFDASACRQKWQVPERSVCLLYLGRLSPYSKADLTPLLLSFQSLKARCPQQELMLVLAGGAETGTLRALEATVRELGMTPTDVRLCPNLTDEEKKEWLAAADVFVSPVDNHQETFGLSILEAMASGLPVVCSDFDGYKELVDEGVTGYKIPTLGGVAPGFFTESLGVLDPHLAQFVMAQTVAVDLETLTRRLEQLVNDAPLRIRMGQAGKLRVKQSYTWRQVIPQFEALWTELKTQVQQVSTQNGPVDPYTGDLFSVFRHYPTRLQTPQMAFTLSTLGRQVLEGRLPMPAVYEDLQPLLQGELITALMKVFSQHTLTVELCTQLAEKELHFPPEWTRFQIQWLYKNGMIALTQESST